MVILQHILSARQISKHKIKQLGLEAGALSTNMARGKTATQTQIKFDSVMQNTLQDAVSQVLNKAVCIISVVTVVTVVLLVVLVDLDKAWLLCLSSVDEEVGVALVKRQLLFIEANMAHFYL